MKILLLDIETAPNTAYVWGIWQETIPLARVIESGGVLCYSAKWLDSDEIYFDSIHKSTKKSMLRGIHGLLCEADAVIHYNGARFDIPILNKEFLLAGMLPPSPYKQIDLLRVARDKFRFLSNKLDYVAQQLGLGKKHETDFQLWVQCMNKDDEAWQRMEDYNTQDVLLLEKVYYKFRPYITNHPNVGVYTASSVCPNCGSTDHQKRGYSYTSACKYQRYQCNGCGHWFREATMDKTRPKPVTYRHAN